MSEDLGDPDLLVKISLMVHMNTQKQLFQTGEKFEINVMIRYDNQNYDFPERLNMLWSAPACGFQIDIKAQETTCSQMCFGPGQLLCSILTKMQRALRGALGTKVAQIALTASAFCCSLAVSMRVLRASSWRWKIASRASRSLP